MLINISYLIWIRFCFIPVVSEVLGNVRPFEWLVHYGWTDSVNKVSVSGPVIYIQTFIYYFRYISTLIFYACKQFYQNRKSHGIHPQDYGLNRSYYYYYL